MSKRSLSLIGRRRLPTSKLPKSCQSAAKLPSNIALISTLVLSHLITILSGLQFLSREVISREINIDLVALIVNGKWLLARGTALENIHPSSGGRLHLGHLVLNYYRKSPPQGIKPLKKGQTATMSCSVALI